MKSNTGEEKDLLRSKVAEIRSKPIAFEARKSTGTKLTKLKRQDRQFFAVSCNKINRHNFSLRYTATAAATTGK